MTDSFPAGSFERDCFDRACIDAGTAGNTYVFVTYGFSFFVQFECSERAYSYTGCAANAEIPVNDSGHFSVLLR